MSSTTEPVWKTIVCLANSRKRSGRCIAGIEIGGDGDPVGWIRPVSDREHQEVSERERQYEDGTDPRVLDILSVPLLAAKPENYQSENWLLDPSIYWAKNGRFEWSQLRAFEDREPLWLEDSSSTYHGLRNRVEADVALSIRDSLRLIHVTDLTLRVFAPGQKFDNPKRSIQASFTHLGSQYRLSVTDPVIERRYLAGPDGKYPLGDAYLTVSLGEPYDGYVYKLVAAVIVQSNSS